MNIEFYCRCQKKMLTVDECKKVFNWEGCMGCSSEQSAGRQALFDWLKASFADQYSVSMEADSVRICVHDHLCVLADPGDVRYGTYVLLAWNDGEGTHLHPDDVQQYVAELLAGEQVILLDDADREVMTLSRVECKVNPELLAGCCKVVDAFGVHTIKTYVSKLCDD